MKKQNYILVRLKGGLGNQLFQYHAAYNLAKDKNYELVLDICNLKKDNLRDFELHHLNINCKIIKSKASRIFFILIKSIRNLSLPFFHNEILEYSFDENIKDIDTSIILNGYYQNEKYFSEISHEIKSFFSKLYKEIKNEKILDIMINTNSIAIHIRRGDYINNDLTNKIHGICDIDYYKAAIKYFSNQNTVFFIFSDDIQWCKKNINIDGNVFFVSDICNSDIEEFLLMQNCKNFIISNSTFSWWAAWLASNHNKTVICPKNWFKDQTLNQLSKKLIPQNWLRF